MSINLSSKFKVRFAYLSEFFEFVEAKRIVNDDTCQLTFKCKKCLLIVVSKENNDQEVFLNNSKNHITNCNLSNLSDFLKMMSNKKLLAGKRKSEENNESEANSENKKARLENSKINGKRESANSQRIRDEAFKQIMQYMINLPNWFLNYESVFCKRVYTVFFNKIGNKLSTSDQKFCNKITSSDCNTWGPYI